MAGDPTPLRSPEAVAALWAAWGDRAAVLNVLLHVPTWADLVHLPQTARLALVGPTAAQVPLPGVCPPINPLPGGAHPLTGYDAAYPPELDPATWPVLYVNGAIPPGPRVMIGGAESPSPQGTEIARSAALACAAEHVPVVAVVHPGAGMTAIRTAVAAGARVVAVVPHGLDQVTIHQGLLDQVRAGGGAVLTPARPGPERPPVLTEAIAAAVDLSMAVVIAEVGAPPGHSADVTRAAVEHSRYLIAPTPPRHHVPASALGLEVMTRPGAFQPDWYGSSARVSARAAAGLPAADVVVADQAQITAAIRQACRPTT